MSGMRPTGKLHLGHLVGALQNWVRLQSQYDCFYCVVDWHALTTHYADTGEIVANAFDNVADWIGAGLDPEQMLKSIRSGAAGCWSLDNLAPRVLKGDFEPGFIVEHFIKDMGIALADAEKMQLALPGLALSKQLYEAVRAQGVAIGPENLRIAENAALILPLHGELDRARERGCVTADLTSRPSREAANRLYQRLGFAPRESTVYRYDLRSSG